MSPETVTPESQPTTAAFQEFSWVKGRNAKWDSVAVRLRDDGRVYLGLKGFDKKHNSPGYIAVEMTAEGLHRLDGLLQEARAVLRASDAEE